MDKVGLVHVALPSQMHPASVAMEMGLASLPPRRLCSLRKETGFQRTQSHRLREGILAQRGSGAPHLCAYRTVPPTPPAYFPPCIEVGTVA